MTQPGATAPLIPGLQPPTMPSVNGRQAIPEYKVGNEVIQPSGYAIVKLQRNAVFTPDFQVKSDATAAAILTVDWSKWIIYKDAKFDGQLVLNNVLKVISADYLAELLVALSLNGWTSKPDFSLFVDRGDGVQKDLIEPIRALLSTKSDKSAFAAGDVTIARLVKGGMKMIASYWDRFTGLGPFQLLTSGKYAKYNWFHGGLNNCDGYQNQMIHFLGLERNAKLGTGIRKNIKVSFPGQYYIREAKGSATYLTLYFFVIWLLYRDLGQSSMASFTEYLTLMVKPLTEGSDLWKTAISKLKNVEGITYIFAAGVNMTAFLTVDQKAMLSEEALKSVAGNIPLGVEFNKDVMIEELKTIKKNAADIKKKREEELSA